MKVICVCRLNTMVLYASVMERNRISMDYLCYSINSLALGLHRPYSTPLSQHIYIRSELENPRGLYGRELSNLGSCLTSLLLHEASSSCCVSAAVIAKLQPRGASLQAARKTTTVKETFGHDRNSILYWFIFLPLSSSLCC